jgi:peptide/nickel transport system substrate-binding protein
MKKSGLTRRDFLKQAAAFSAAAAIPPEALAFRSAGSLAAQAPEVAPGVPRDQCLILENPTGTVLPADDFNRWRPGSNTYSTGFQQLALDTLWYIDPDAGVKGVWDNALAAEKPIYNADYSQMTVKLRQGLYWSDGVEFTADDLFYTVDVQMKTPGFAYNGLFAGNIEKLEQPDKYTVIRWSSI